MIDPAKLVGDKNNEDAFQAAIFCWAALPETQAKYPELKHLFFSIPNGGQRDKREAAKLKATGTKAGVADMFLAVPRGPYHGFFIELKRFGGPTRENQLEFGRQVQQQGYAWAVYEGWQHAIEKIEGYLNIER